MANDPLPSWNHAAARERIVTFVEDTITRSVPVEDRIAVFDNDGTLWSEQPTPPQLHFVIEHWRQQAARDRALALEQPYKAAVEGDLAWIADAVRKHHAGDDTDLRVIMRAILGVTSGRSVEAYEKDIEAFYASAVHPVLGVSYRFTVYQPMIELLRFLENNGFSCYIVSGSDRDFMRPVSTEYYGLSRENIIGSAVGLDYDPATNELRYGSEFEYFNDGPLKPARIWSRLGRRPLVAVGNSDGDLPMLQFLSTQHPTLPLLVHHDDDAGRGDVPYDHGAQTALAEASQRDITVVSVCADWNAVFPPHDPPETGR